MDTTVLATIVLFSVFFITLFVGIPISVGIALASFVTILTILPYDMAIFTLSQKLFSGIDSFTLLSIPFFILSGHLMNKGGIAIRLVRLAELIGGRLPGSLLQANVVGNMLFGSISGSSVAAAAAIGGVMAPLQKKEGYNPALSAAVNIASAPTGILIPPSGPLIVYSLVSGGTSIAALFMGGYIPGILMGLLVISVGVVLSIKDGHKARPAVSFSVAIKIILEALSSLMLIVIVIGGIIGGIFTATEGAAIAVVYSLILSFLYREIKKEDIIVIFGEALQSSAVVLFLIATSSMMANAMALTGIPNAISNIVLSISDNKYVVFFVMNMVLLVAGTFLDLTPAVLLFTPIFLPIAMKFGMDPVQFGIMLIYNMGLGNMTPPVGTVLFVGCKVGGVSIEQVTVKLLPIFLAVIVGLMMVTYIPSLSLALPKMFGLM